MKKALSFILILVCLPFCCGLVSTNVPLNHWSYRTVDKLIAHGLIESSMSTKPFSRLEMARLITQADEKARLSNEENEIILGILERLKTEFQDELNTTGHMDGNPVGDFLKPIEAPYVKYLSASKQPDLENRRGDVFEKDSNLRFGFVSRMRLFNQAALYIHPEYSQSTHDTDKDAEFIEAYGKIMLGPLEIQAGKDSLWWGPGHHGALLMSNNAEPFKMIKISNPQPVQLPWIFRTLGPFKAVLFLTKLEKDRFVPETELIGMRINFKPHPILEIGLSRSVMLGGQTRPDLAVRDYWDIFWASKENRPGKLDNNQLAGFDVSLQFPLCRPLPGRTLKLYTECIGEDEAGGLPSNFGKMYGLRLGDILRTGRTDLIFEYANNNVPGKPNVFYNHHIYRSGYTYRSRIIGHHMGTDSEDWFLRISHYLNKDLILGLEYDREIDTLSSSPDQTTDIYAVDLTYFTSKNWQIKTGYRYEDQKNSRFVSGQTKNTHIFSLDVVYSF
jgi:hypothetical protein